MSESNREYIGSVKNDLSDSSVVQMPEFRKFVCIQSELLSARCSPRICECVAVPPPEPTGDFAKALHLHEEFCQKSDLDAADQSIQTYTALLAEDDHLHHLSPLVYPPIKQLPSCFGVDARRIHILVHLAQIYQERYLYRNHIDDLNYAVKYAQDACVLCSGKRLVCPTVAILSASILMSHADYTSEHEEVTMAESFYRGIIPICPNSHPLKATALRGLGWVLLRLFEITGSAALLDDAILQQTHALTELLPSQSHTKHRHLRYLGIYLVRKFQTVHDPNVLEKALGIKTEALNHCPEKHVDMPKIVHDMLFLLRKRLNYHSSREDLDQAIGMGRRALEVHSPYSVPTYSSILFSDSLADLLSLRQELYPTDGNDFQEPIKLRREVLRFSPRTSIGYWSALSSLSTTLRQQYAWNGDLDFLDEAIYVSRQASLVPQNYRIGENIALNLAENLMFSFSEVGNIEDLNETIDCIDRAMTLISPTYASYPQVALAKASYLCTRYERTQETSDLDQAVTLAQSVLDIVLPDSNHLTATDAVQCMAQALLLRGNGTNDISDINKAIETLTPIICTVSQRGSGSECLRIIVDSHRSRFFHTRDPDDATHALRYTQIMLDAAPSGRRGRYKSLITAAKVYVEHGTTYRSFSMTLSYLHDALSDNHRDIRSRIQGATEILNLIQAHHKDIFAADQDTQLQLLHIYGSVVRLLPRVAFLGLHLRSRLVSLGIGQSVAVTGASHALNISMPEMALEILEQGRAIFWTHTLRLRSPFDAVPEKNRSQLLLLARQLERTDPAAKDPRAVESEVTRRRKQSEQFNALLETIRRYPGMERFLLPDEYAKLATAAKEGPVVVLVSSALGCHAVVINSSGDVMGIPLKQVTQAWLVESSATWNSEMTQTRTALRYRLKMLKVASPHKLKHTRSEEILRRLWFDVVLPVFNSLQLKPATGRGRPRVWWCPTGNFVHLPIHAAGADGDWATNYIVSSYTPTLGYLISAREACEPPKKSDILALLAAVPQPNTSQWHDLLFSREEVSIVSEILPAGMEIPVIPANCTLGKHENGITAERLLKNLPKATILHLACHAYQDPENALKSGFVMQDETLTIERLMQTPLSCAFMAFLSACETAKGDKDQPDQVVHLAATLLFAGFKTVIATLWSMEDVDGPLIAKSVYEDLFSRDAEYLNPDDIAYALDEAVLKLRLVHPEPSRWAPYIHLGI